MPTRRPVRKTILTKAGFCSILHFSVLLAKHKRGVVVITCAHCGAEILKENARFCTKCGTPVAKPSSSSSSQSPVTDPATFRPSPAVSVSPLSAQADEPVSPPRPASRKKQSEAPAWMSNLESSVLDIRGSAHHPPTHEANASVQLPFPAPEVIPPAPATGAAFRVKVWEEQGVQPDVAQMDTVVSPSFVHVDELPTRETPTPMPPQSRSRPADAVQPQSSRKTSASPMADSARTPMMPPLSPTAAEGQRDDITQLSTTPLALSPVVPSTPRPPQVVQMGTALPVYGQSEAVSGPPVAEPLGTQTAGRTPSRESMRPRMLIALALVLILVVSGVMAWVVIAQPLSVAPVTNPLQSFRNGQLGVTLRYPTGWQVHVDQKKSEAFFTDSTHTAQVNLLVTPATALGAARYVQTLPAQLGMSAVKTETPLTFAGATWQQIRGTVQQNGAGYTETVFVTTHGNRLVTLMQLAPQNVYAQEEQVVFAPLRASFRFL